MKKSAKSRIIIWSVVSVVLIGILVSGMVLMEKSDFNIFNMGSISINIDSFDSANSIDITDETVELNADEINNIIVGWSSGDVKIDVAKTDKILIAVNDYTPKNQNDVVHYVNKNGTLGIYSEKSDSINLFDNFTSKKITITIPEDKFFDSVEVSTASAEAEINGVNAESVNMDTASGDIGIMNSQGNEVSMNSASGNINIVGCSFTNVNSTAVSGETNVEGQFENFDSESVSGSVYINSHNECKKIDCEAVSGSVYITLPKTVNSVNVDFDSVSGDLTSEFGNITSDNALSIDLETVSGSAIVQKAA